MAQDLGSVNVALGPVLPLPIAVDQAVPIPAAAGSIPTHVDSYPERVVIHANSQEEFLSGIAWNDSEEDVTAAIFGKHIVARRSVPGEQDSPYEFTFHARKAGRKSHKPTHISFQDSHNQVVAMYRFTLVCRGVQAAKDHVEYVESLKRRRLDVLLPSSHPPADTNNTPGATNLVMEKLTMVAVADAQKQKQISEWQEAYNKFRGDRDVVFALADKKKRLYEPVAEFNLRFIQWAMPYWQGDTPEFRALFAARSSGLACIQLGLNSLLPSEYLTKQGWSEMANVALFLAPVCALHYIYVTAARYKDLKLDNWLDILALNAAAKDTPYEFLVRYAAVMAKVEPKDPLAVVVSEKEDPFPTGDMKLVLEDVFSKPIPPQLVEEVTALRELTRIAARKLGVVVSR